MYGGMRLTIKVYGKALVTSWEEGLKLFREFAEENQGENFMRRPIFVANSTP
jgi:hypothetical protein